MKHFLAILFFAAFFIAGAQTKDSLAAKFQGTCVISSGSITVNDFQKLDHICPPKLTKVIRYKYTHQPKGTHRKNASPVYYESNELDFKKGHKPVKPGDIIIFDEIVGLGADKKRTNGDGIVLTIQ